MFSTPARNFVEAANEVWFVRKVLQKLCARHSGGGIQEGQNITEAKFRGLARDGERTIAPGPIFQSR
jgi:hypothetical protein